MKICKYCGQELKIPNTLGGRLAYKRVERDKSRADSAAVLGVSTALIATIEKGKSDIRFGQFECIHGEEQPNNGTLSRRILQH